jgi:toxin ParE1/3/4
MGISIGPTARTDLIAVWRWIANDNPQAATEMLYRIEKAMLNIDAFPEMGPKRPEIGSDARTHSVGPFLILYRVKAEIVEIVRVLHSSRNITRQLYLAGLSR